MLLRLIQAHLELLDCGMRILEILVQTVSFRDELNSWQSFSSLVASHLTSSTHMLFPLPEPRFLKLDLLRESLTQQLLFFLEFGVVQLLDLCLAKLARLHLRLAVRFIVRFFGRRYQVEHVHAQQEGTEFTEIAVGFVVDCERRAVRPNPHDRTGKSYLLLHPIGIVVP